MQVTAISIGVVLFVRILVLEMFMVSPIFSEPTDKNDIVDKTKVVQKASVNIDFFVVPIKLFKHVL